MKKLIVIGNGMVGYKFCEKLVSSNGSDEFDITVFGEEPRPAYDRVHLSEYMSNKSAEQLLLAPANWYKDNHIKLHTSSLVSRVDTKNKQITTYKNQVFPYDYLVFATGSSAFIPPIKGLEKKGVFVYRTLEDLDAIKSYANQLKIQGKQDAVILGGGLLGLEAANASKALGLKTHVVEFAPRLMPRQLDGPASDLLVRKIQDLGIEVLLEKSTKTILGDTAIEGLAFSDATQLKTDMLIISAGIRPRDELAKAAGITVGERGGILVNEKMQTSEKDVYAIGEVALYNQAIYGLVAPGYDMAKVAVAQLLEDHQTVMDPKIDLSTQLKLIGTEVGSFGDPFISDQNVSVITYENKFKGIYKRINVSKDGQKLYGGILVGDTSDYNSLFQLYNNNMRLPENPEDLILGSRGSSTGASGNILELPDTAQICSCESVNKGQICGLIEDGSCNSLSEVIDKTKATTGCGGCKPMVSELVEVTLKSLGKQVKQEICEHFGYNRQELYDLIKINKVTSFDQALELFGNGSGCETCKPLLASLFSSIYMETANKQVEIQDSNDRFLANIQRNGTYSIVPRVPGGEITPEKLISLGEVAQKFNLYTKITGGQRIDLFGAQLHELPLIWKELIEAGFESGHAYGKSLRTVKSCVGSTWCRFGMHESVSFAIEIENRYKGLRSPHKLKGGVSGCIRECAEARGKDFGLIAVEGGWNLYVCGNGGANPKHAILLAEQLDEKTCIKYLDRFLMYYIRTAAPLMRTAAWLEKLDGGIDYLKRVIIEDSLGIATELENEMMTLINHYQCEWKQAIEDPQMVKRFKHFVNSDQVDDTINFVPLRDQKMPRAWR